MEEIGSLGLLCLEAKEGLVHIQQNQVYNYTKIYVSYLLLGTFVPTLGLLQIVL